MGSSQEILKRGFPKKNKVRSHQRGSMVLLHFVCLLRLLAVPRPPDNNRLECCQPFNFQSMFAVVLPSHVLGCLPLAQV